MKISQGIPLISEWHICGIGVNTVYIYKKLDETRDSPYIQKWRKQGIPCLNELSFICGIGANKSGLFPQIRDCRN